MEVVAPAAELLLLGELVGLIVLERHQLFEPVHEKVGSLGHDMSRVLDSLGSITEKLDSSGQITTYANPRDLLTARVRLLREALMRNDEGPHILRQAFLSGRNLIEDTREVGQAFKELREVIAEYQLLPDSPQDARSRRWSCRALYACATSEHFNRLLEFLRTIALEPGSLNLEFKIIVRAQPEALLSPEITDRDVVLIYEDGVSSHRWGLVLQGRQYVTLVGRWFDDRWAATPDRYQIFGRGIINQKAIDLVRKELAAAEAARDREIA